MCPDYPRALVCELLAKVRGGVMLAKVRGRVIVAELSDPLSQLYRLMNVQQACG